VSDLGGRCRDPKKILNVARTSCRARRADSGAPGTCGSLHTAQRTPVRPGIGLWRSVVAHLTGGQGVAGSNPVSPTSVVAGQRPFPLMAASAWCEWPTGRGSDVDAALRAIAEIDQLDELWQLPDSRTAGDDR
jgi:hypothetical protein